MGRVSNSDDAKPTDAGRPWRGRLLRLARVLGVFLAGLALFASQAASSVPPRLVEAQGLTDTKVELAWTAEAGADSYRVYRDGAFVTEQPGTLYEDGSLLPSSLHNYAVSAVSGGIESPLSTTSIAQTQAPTDTTPPTQPGPIALANITSSTADLDWSGPATTLTSSAIESFAGRWCAAFPAGANRYHRWFVPLRRQGIFGAERRTSSASSLWTLKTTIPRSKPSPSRRPVARTRPRLPLHRAAVLGRSRSRRLASISPGHASSSSDIASYRVYRDGVQVGDVALPLRKTFSDVGLTPGQSYAYTIRAVDSAGNLSSPTTCGPVTCVPGGITPAEGTVLIRRGPYIQWVTPTSARIAWWTNIPTASVVEYGLGVLTDSAADPVPRTQHMMLIGGLTPGTAYQYRVGDGTVTSGTFSFSTAAVPGATFSFAAVGDFGGGSRGRPTVANRIATAGTQFTQTVGDNVYPDAQDPDFTTFYSDFDSRFFKQYAQVVNKQSFWPANGNKEYYGDGAHWRMFWLPNNERWYSYDWGDAHILVLDSEQTYTPGSPQYEFASADLSASQDAKFRIVVIHRPPYSSTSNNSNSEGEQTHLVPLFEQQHVQLVLSGNSHNYERSHPLIGGAPAAGGTVYVVTGGGGNGHNPFTIPQPAWSAHRNDSDYQYTRVTVSPQSLQLDAIKGANGAIFDSTVIDAPGKIVVRKDAQPNSGQAFDFTAGGGLSPSSFQLDDDGDNSNTLSNERTFAQLAPGSGYSVSETAPPSGWELASTTCDDGSPPANIGNLTGRDSHMPVGGQTSSDTPDRRAHRP